MADPIAYRPVSEISFEVTERAHEFIEGGRSIAVSMVLDGERYEDDGYTVDPAALMVVGTNGGVGEIVAPTTLDTLQRDSWHRAWPTADGMQLSRGEDREDPVLLPWPQLRRAATHVCDELEAKLDASPDEALVVGIALDVRRQVQDLREALAAAPRHA